jgi:hypothetical protein
VDNLPPAMGTSALYLPQEKLLMLIGLHSQRFRAGWKAHEGKTTIAR